MIDNLKLLLISILTYLLILLFNQNRFLKVDNEFKADVIKNKNYVIDSIKDYNAEMRVHTEKIYLEYLINDKSYVNFNCNDLKGIKKSFVQSEKSILYDIYDVVDYKNNKLQTIAISNKTNILKILDFLKQFNLSLEYTDQVVIYSKTNSKNFNLLYY